MQASAGGKNNTDTINNNNNMHSSPSNFISPSSPSLKISMEEVWKDITLSSLTDHRTTASATAANNPGSDLSNIILQDFLAKPFNKESGNSGEPPSAPPLPLPSSASDFECNYIRGQNHRAPYFEELGSPTCFPSFCENRVQEISGNFRDRRHKRMMKNRESAARSRARKQAYTNELELEIAHLQEENATLKRQQEKLLSAPTQLPKKNTIQRSLEAPF